FTSGKYAVVEASYVDPDIISQKKSVSEVVSDDLFYHSSRGSEPELSFGMAYLCALTSENSDLAIYAGSHKHQLLFDPRVIKVEHQFINSFIGQDISSQKIITILTHLGFDVRAEEDAFMITIPAFRHDVCHAQDVIEELVRITGIDNIASKALTFKESHQINETYVRYKKRTHFRHKAASIGFFESVHYFFDNKALMDKYELPILNEALDVTNPITNELTTLRSTLLLHLINSASRNAKFGKKSIRLFEIGRVVNTSRGEQSKIAFIFSGEREAPSVDNHGKPALINFFEFAKMVSSVVGKFTLEESDVYNPLVSPYEYANVIIEGKRVGFIARTHIKLEQEFDLSNSYVCELDFDLLKYDKIIAKAYSKFPALSRDLSLLVPKEIKFSAIRNFLAKALPQEVISFAPIDIYESEDLGDLHSVTVKFHLQSETQTLQDEQITAIMDTILVQLKEKFGIGMR
nr:phenylalanine--tRNA ligase subunit beta [Campylobacterota bacterium]